MTLRRTFASLAGERGFSLIELVTVLIVLGMFLTTAVVSFGAMRASAADATARLNVAGAMEASYSYYAANGTYRGLTLTRLRAIDRGLRATGLSIVFARATTVCISNTISGGTWYRVYPGGTFTQTRCR
jgi:prepilin-type N-terminal cleavage/methylation domain-containing protein